MNSWPYRPLSEFLTERKGRYKPNDPKITSYKRLNKIDFSGQTHISEKPSKTNMIIIEPGDLVISGINVAKGALAVYEGTEPVVATIHYSSYIFDSNKIDIDFLKRFLKSPAFITELQDQVKGGIKTEIKPKHLLPLKVRIPELTEQIKINHHFDAIENETAGLSHEISAQSSYLTQLRQAILKEAIEGKLTAQWRKENPDTEPATVLLEKIKAEKAQLVKEKKIKKQKALPPVTEEEKPFELPDGWEWCRLGAVTNGFQYGTSSKSFEFGECPVLRMGNIQNGDIIWNDLVYSSDKEEIEKFKLIQGDLLFNRTNSRELVGKTGLYKGERDSIYAGYLIRFHMAGLIVPNYTNFVLNSPLHANWCNEVKSDAIGQSNINATKLSNFRYPLPPLQEQQTIVTKVEKLFALCDQLETRITKNQTHADQLMQVVLKEAFDPDGQELCRKQPLQSKEV